MRKALLIIPEADVAALALLLNFVWEMWQVPWYQGMSQASHLEGVIACSRAAFGDVVVTLLAYTGTALVTRDRLWPLAWSIPRVGAYLAIGVVITIVLEWLATAVLDRWQYADTMITVPCLGTGLAPLLQWLVLPLLILPVLRRLWSSA